MLIDTTSSTNQTESGSTPPTARTDLLGLTFAELGEWMRVRSLPSFRARQVASWIYRSLVADFASMRNLPGTLREALDLEATIEGPRVCAEVSARDGRTRKVLLELSDGRLIETVLMLYPATTEGRARATVCLSTQAGCAVDCEFFVPGVYCP